MGSCQLLVLLLIKEGQLSVFVLLLIQVGQLSVSGTTADLSWAVVSYRYYC